MLDQVLTKSTYHRYLEELGNDVGEIPPGMYPGEYLKDVAKQLVIQYGDKWVNDENWFSFIRDFAINQIMNGISKDLVELGVQMDLFASERDIVNSGKLDEILIDFTNRNLVYTGTLAEPPKGKQVDDWEPHPVLLFKATEFGDDVDRPLKKSDGSWTYFANDIAYHAKKAETADILIDVWGADHGGYVKRMQAAVNATVNESHLEVKLCQLVHLMENGVPIKFSKRSGTFITLREVLEAVGRDVIRFMMLTRKNDQTLEFDFAKVVEKSKENPVFYVQYCHARCRSVLRKADQFNLKSVPVLVFEHLVLPEELSMIQILAEWPRIVEAAADAHEPHRIAFYLRDVAAVFHSLWKNGGKFINPENENLTLARLSLVKAVSIVIASGLNVMGVSPVEEMWAEENVEI